MLLLAACCISACATVNQERPVSSDSVEIGTLPEFDETALLSGSNRDMFKVGDKAIVTVFNVEDLSGSYIVNRSGNIVMPLIGGVKAAGRSVEELQIALTQEFGESYLKDPSVNVDIEQVALGRIIVDGAVNKAGAYDVNEVIGLSEAIAMAGGVTLEADREQVYVVRNQDGKRYIQEANLNKIWIAAESDVRLVPGDIVFVQDSTGRILFNDFLRTVPLITTFMLYGVR